MYIFKKSDIGNYADDNSLYAIASTMQQLVSVLRNETALAIHWIRQNNMQVGLKTEKFQLIYFDNKVEQTEHIFNDFSLKPSESVTLLAVQLDINLNFSEHISKIVRKGERALYAVRRLREYVNTECCMFLLKSYIVIKMYCCAVWHYTNKTNTLKIENVLKKGLRIIFQDYSSTYKVLSHKANLTELHTCSSSKCNSNQYLQNPKWPSPG